MFGPTPCLENKQQLLSDKFELTYSRQLHRCIPTTKHWESLHPNNGRCLRQLQLINPHLKESFAKEYSTGTTFTIITLWDLYDISWCSTNPCTYLVTNMHLQCQTYVQYNSRMFSGAKIHKHLHHIRIPDWPIFYMIFSSHFRNWFPCEIFPNTTLLELALDYIKEKHPCLHYRLEHMLCTWQTLFVPCFAHQLELVGHHWCDILELQKRFSNTPSAHAYILWISTLP